MEQQTGSKGTFLLAIAVLFFDTKVEEKPVQTEEVKPEETKSENEGE